MAKALLGFLLGEGFEDAMDGISTRLEGGNDILGRRLKQSHNVGDELVLALDIGKGLKLVFTNIDCLFNISGFQAGENVVFLAEALEELGRSVADVGTHQRACALEGGIKLLVVAIEGLQGLVEQSILDNHQLDVVLEALATKRGGLLGIESGGLYQVEAAVFLDGFCDFRYDESFLFFFIVVVF